MRALLAIVALAATSSAFAGTYYYNGVLNTFSPTYDNPNGSSAGSNVHYYHALEFTVDVTGNYTFESASPNTTGTPSNALDTFINIYANTFNPLSPGASHGFDDDFTGTLSVLPGPYAGTISATATGFTGAQPSSQILNLALTAGTTYFLVNTSFRTTSYVQTSNEGGPTGPFYTGISGPGNFNPVPEPGTMIALGLGAAALLKRRRSKKA